LAKNLATINKPAKKIPRKKAVSITKTAKTTTPIVPIRQKLLPLPRPGARKPKNKVLVVLPKQVGNAGIIITKTASRLINLP
jgi:hypothetical protein